MCSSLNNATPSKSYMLSLSKNEIDGGIEERIRVSGGPDSYIAPLGKAVVAYINGTHFMGREIQSTENDPLFMWLRDNPLTDGQTENIYRLLDEVVLHQDLRELDFLNADVNLQANCTISLATDETEGGDLFPEIRYHAESVYDLFLIEGFEMLRFGVKIGKCAHCGKFYLPVSNHARKYCSDTCRNQSHETQSPAYTAFRKADRAKRQYLNRNRSKTAQSRYDAWKTKASSARFSYEREEITWSEYDAILKIDIKS